MKNKIVLITGTNSGFGWLTANSCAAEGHTVYATMRDTKGRNAEKARLLIQRDNIHVLDVEITSEKSVNDAIAAIIEKEGRIDVVVNNLVANTILTLIHTPKGKRPLRTVVDPATGSFSEIANRQVKEQYDNSLTAFGMQSMLN